MVAVRRVVERGAWFRREWTAIGRSRRERRFAGTPLACQGGCRWMVRPGFRHRNGGGRAVYTTPGPGDRAGSAPGVRPPAVGSPHRPDQRFRSRWAPAGWRPPVTVGYLQGAGPVGSPADHCSSRGIPAGGSRSAVHASCHGCSRFHRFQHRPFAQPRLPGRPPPRRRSHRWPQVCEPVGLGVRRLPRP